MLADLFTQSYHILRLKFHDSNAELPEVNFTSLELQADMYHTGKRAAHIVVTDPNNVLRKPMTTAQVFGTRLKRPIQIKCIQYMIVASPRGSRKTYTQEFFHPVDNYVFLDGWKLTHDDPMSKPMFSLYSMNDLFETNVFAFDEKGTQFIS